MKRLLLVLLFTPVLISAQTVKFMGVPVDYSYEKFKKELSKKLQLNSDSVYYCEFRGTFAGIDNCVISVANSQTRDVTRIMVEKILIDQPEIAPKLKSSYDGKYGRPIEENYLGGPIYTYKMGDTQINLCIHYDQNLSPNKIVITYFPREYKKSDVSDDDI